MRALQIDSASVKTLGYLPPKHFRQVVSKLFELLKEPLPTDARLLSGFPFYRVTVGEYRVVYDFTDTQVRVLMLGKRNDGEIYRMLQRRL